MPARSPKKRAVPRPLPRGRNRLPPEEVLANQRRRLIAAIQDSVARTGYSKTSVTTVTRVARVARPVFYRAFPEGKEQCFLEAYEENVDFLFSRMSEACARAQDNLGAIEAGMRALTTELARSPQKARLVLIDVTALGTEGLNHRDHALERATRLLQRALGERDTSLTSERRFRALIGGCYQLLYQTVADERTTDLPALVGDMLYMILAYLPDLQSSARKSDTARRPQAQRPA